MVIVRLNYLKQIKGYNTMSKKSNTSGGIGFVGLLTITFIVLKLCKVISWSWWWVLSPIWIVAILVVVAIIIAIISSR